MERDSLERARDQEILDRFQGLVEDASQPTTHPLRKGGWVRPTDPTLRAAEEGAMVTGREEVINQP